MNPKVKIGDRLLLVYMEDELDVSTKDKGTVTSVTRDPFETDECYIIGVKWDNGSLILCGAGICTVVVLGAKAYYKLKELGIMGGKSRRHKRKHHNKTKRH